MNYSARSIRTFIGAKNYNLSIQFYKELGYEHVLIGEKLSYFRIQENIGFYLQDAYIKDWINNTMIFLEVDELDQFELDLNAKDLVTKYNGVRISKIHNESWGRELFMHDPSGVLWHFGEFIGES